MKAKKEESQKRQEGRGREKGKNNTSPLKIKGETETRAVEVV